MNYRKKPVVIEAFQWTGGPDQTEDPVWICDAIRDGAVRVEGSGTPDLVMVIQTLEGPIKASVGDWIIRGVKGELYPCKPDIFAMTYEAANGGPLEVRQLIETGGPAFPQHCVPQYQARPELHGMSLRDYFAAMAMQGLLSDFANRESMIRYADRVGWSFSDEVAIPAYAIACAMMRARQK